MASLMTVSSSSADGNEPQTKKMKLLVTEADRAEVYASPAKKMTSMVTEADRPDVYLATEQPGRVPLHKISWHHETRGGHGIDPFHVHGIARM